MRSGSQPVRVLYSFPHKLGADRICYTAWQQVNGLAAAGAEVLVFPGVLHKPVPAGVKVRPTLARGKFRVPYRLLGTIRSCALHDHIVSRRIEKLAGQIDIIHTWPLGALRTLKAASRLAPGVPDRPLDSKLRGLVAHRHAEHRRVGPRPLRRLEPIYCRSRKRGVAAVPALHSNDH